VCQTRVRASCNAADPVLVRTHQPTALPAFLPFVALASCVGNGLSRTRSATSGTRTSSSFVSPLPACVLHSRRLRNSAATQNRQRAPPLAASGGNFYVLAAGLFNSLLCSSPSPLWPWGICGVLLLEALRCCSYGLKPAPSGDNNQRCEANMQA